MGRKKLWMNEMSSDQGPSYERSFHVNPQRGMVRLVIKGISRLKKMEWHGQEIKWDESRLWVHRDWTV